MKLDCCMNSTKAVDSLVDKIVYARKTPPETDVISALPKNRAHKIDTVGPL